MLLLVVQTPQAAIAATPEVTSKKQQLKQGVLVGLLQSLAGRLISSAGGEMLPARRMLLLMDPCRVLMTQMVTKPKTTYPSCLHLRQKWSRWGAWEQPYASAVQAMGVGQYLGIPQHIGSVGFLCMHK